MRTKHLFRLGKVVLLGFAIAVFLASSMGGVENAKGYNISPAFAQNLANTYYVSPSGSDSNLGTQAQPWQSIQKAANVAVAGDMVIVAAGNYTERVRVTHSGITFKAQGNVTMQGITIAADNTTFDGFYVLNSTSTEGGIEIKSDGNTIRNNRVEGATMVGILVQGDDNLVENNDISKSTQRGGASWVDGDGIRFFGDKNIIRGNYIHDIDPHDSDLSAHNDCFQTWDDAVRGQSTNTIIENNRCDMIYDQDNPDGYNPHQGGGNLEDPINLTIRNNVFIGQHGLFIYNAQNVQVTNNTLVGYFNPVFIDQYNEIAIALYSTGSTVTFQNNIVYNMWKHVVRTGGGSVVGGWNLAYRSDGKSVINDSGYDNSDDLWAINPLFVNPATGDFHLQLNSPARTGGKGGTYVGAFPYNAEILPTNTPAPTLTTLPPTQVPQSTETPIPPIHSSSSTLLGLSWEAEEGEITSPFAIENGVVSQNTLTDNPVDGGRALYQFTVQDAGEYIVKAMVNAADAGSNSLFVGMDSEPDTSMIWDVILTNGFEERTASWREGAAPDANASTPKIFYLASGEHTLVIRGREANTLLDKVEVAKVPVIQPTITASPTATLAQLPTQDPMVTPTPMPINTEPATPTPYASSPLPTATGTQMPTTATQACDIIINAGEAIVTQANKTTCLHGGTYVQIVNISADKAKLTSYPGEHAIIDGQNSLAANYGALVRITGGYVEVSDIEVQRSGITGTGIRLTGTHGLISNVNVHHCMGSGIHVDGDYGIVENSEVWSNEMNNENGGSTIDWGFGLSAARYPTGVIMRNNYVHDNWGEGLSTFEATGTLIEGNIIADNWSVNLYISDARDVIARGNTIYTTTTSPVQNGNRVGILLGDERCGSTPSVCSERITVTNNTVRNAGYINLYWWYPSIIDNIITGNTFENAQSQAGVEIHTDTGVVQNTVFENNIIIQTNRLPAIINQTNIDTSKNTVITSQVSTPTPTLTIIPLAATDTPEPMVTNTPMPTLTPTETLISSPQPDLSPLPGLSWEAEQGDITPPFTVENGIVSQNTSSDDPSVNGRALYRFTIQDAGEYVVRAIVNAANSGKNSFFVGMDAEPDTNMIWDIVLTNGFEERTVSWREGAAPDANASTPKVFYLAPGEHSLIIRGREANTLLDKVEVAKALNVQPTTTPVPTQTPVIAETPTVVIAETSTPTAILYTDTPLPTETPLPTFTAAPLDTTPPTITDITNNGYIQWLVTFSEDIGWTGADPANFSLNGASGGPVVIDSISYDSNSYTTTLNLNGGNPLPPDDYTLLVAGTKSITDLAGNKLDGNSDGIGGDDFVQGFSIQAPTSTPTETPVPASPTPTETATATPVPPTATATETATPVPPTATATASEVVYDDKDSAFAYSADWEDVYNRQAYHGSAKETTKDGSFVTLNFTGQTFSVLYTSGKEYREMEVYVDNVLVGTINERNWGWRQTFQKRWDYPGQLTPGAHTLKLVFDTSDKRDRTRGSLDAVIVR